MKIIKDLNHLRELIGAHAKEAPYKIYGSLNERMKDFIRLSPLVMISTIDHNGVPTVSPKGDHPGFVSVQPDGTLLIPERKGNKLIFSLTNLLSNQNIALIFILPGTNESLRIHGVCELLDESEFNELLASKTQQAILTMRVTVKNAYFHCGKAFLRSEIWRHETWSEPMKISFGEEIAKNLNSPGFEVGAFDSGVWGRYKTDL